MNDQGAPTQGLHDQGDATQGYHDRQIENMDEDKHQDYDGDKHMPEQAEKTHQGAAPNDNENGGLSSSDVDSKQAPCDGHVEDEDLNNEAEHSVRDEAVTAFESQLSLCYQGEMYVFETVSPEKVQAILLLLGGHEIPPGMAGVGIAANHGHKDFVEETTPVKDSQKLTTLSRLHRKEKARIIDKKLRYGVQKEVAKRIRHIKGRFASSKARRKRANPELAPFGGNGSKGAPKSDRPTSCLNCGTSARNTPMMRRGPTGPGTLCNACGLNWANKKNKR